ncbi:MAG: hypothetical protein H6662_09535 [Ardenticatenaceae bacterium]|nr:hypothetical protein [Ardenticatenaceae bacterium]MCB8991028.1 hypothetical protein [Ardenticatenaceae bacterium]
MKTAVPTKRPFFCAMYHFLTHSNPPMRRLELGGGFVEKNGLWRFVLPPLSSGYADAQIDDYGRSENKHPPSRRHYPWNPGTHLKIRARFSHDVSSLRGTAGFGFWNAPFGDPTVRWPALPQAAWFFFASAPTDLPLAPLGSVGRGWFAATLDASSRRALAFIPLAPAVLLLNQFPRLRQRIWPAVQQRLGMSFAALPVNMTDWHTYELHWQPFGSTFVVDDAVILQTRHSPHGSLGFVCWLDNQYLVATANGRFSSGTLPITETQWMEVERLEISH